MKKQSATQELEDAECLFRAVMKGYLEHAKSVASLMPESQCREIVSRFLALHSVEADAVNTFRDGPSATFVLNKRWFFLLDAVLRGRPTEINIEQ